MPVNTCGATAVTSPWFLCCDRSSWVGFLLSPRPSRSRVQRAGRAPALARSRPTPTRFLPAYRGFLRPPSSVLVFHRGQAGAWRAVALSLRAGAVTSPRTPCRGCCVRCCIGQAGDRAGGIGLAVSGLLFGRA